MKLFPKVRITERKWSLGGSNEIEELRRRVRAGPVIPMNAKEKAAEEARMGRTL